MKKSLTFSDLIGLVISVSIAIFIYDYWNVWISDLLSQKGDSVWMLLFSILLQNGVGAFISIGTALLFASERYRLISGVIILFIILSINLYDVRYYETSFWGIVGASIRISFFMIGSLLSILLWQLFPGKVNKNMPKPSANQSPSNEQPNSSFALLSLSIFSIPLTYITIFVSSFVTFGLSAVILLVVFQLPRIPIFIIIAGVVAPLISLYASFKALGAIIWPKPSFHPSVILDMNKCVTLKNEIKSVCDGIKTKMPDVVLLHAEPTFFVMQGKINTFDGSAKGRILTMGMPLVNALSSNEVCSILAHEFAHFSGRDTFYSTLVAPVYRGIGSAIKEISQNVGNDESNNTTNLMKVLLIPAQLFLGVFLRYFATIDMILSRSRELRADWLAAKMFGKNHFSSALTKVVQVSGHFNETSENLALTYEDNFFGMYENILKDDASKLEDYKTKALAEEEDEMDSHPTLTVRLQNLPDFTPSVSNSNGEFKNCLLEDGKRLSKQYTDRTKKLKKIYDQYVKMIEQSSKS